MDVKLRKAVFDRDTHCVKCGRYLHDNVHVHHRKLRKQGGKDSLSNLIALCGPCHNIAPDSVHQNPERSYEQGYLVPSWADPEEWPMLLPDGSRVLLQDTGEVIYLERADNGW